ncbi:MAG TPA: glycoside hydrolase family 2 protein, partial [Pilimelia sp.]|nr:glycoside hydrolase family 2 protein [Pilimelia sp.]
TVAELDPTRPYWPGSPYSGTPDRHPNDPAHGTTHIWDVWNREDYTHYRSYAPRFVAEFGYQAPPTYATLRRGGTPHQKAADGDAKLARGLAAHLPRPHTLDDWLYLTQVNQARAIAFGVEHFRSLRPRCMGAIVWQLNDCWPVISWSAIDGEGRPKPLWYALRRVFADRLLTVQPRGSGLALVAVNDATQPWAAEATVSRVTVAGERRAATAIPLAVPAGGAVTLPLSDLDGDLLLVEADGAERAWWFPAEDTDLDYPPARYETSVAPRPGGVAVTVTAHTILRDLCLFPDRLDPAATVDRALVTLLPGESTRFEVTLRARGTQRSGVPQRERKATSAAALDPAALTAAPVLRCVNDLTG